MKQQCVENLLGIKELLKKMTLDEYTQKLEVFNGSSIGQHVRHIVEFYQCILCSKNREMNYDLRKRNLSIEESNTYCIKTIEELLFLLEKVEGNYQVIVDSEFGKMPSSFFRELFYALEHSVHHEALIKIGLQELGLKELVDENFGVANSTIKYKEQCAP